MPSITCRCGSSIRAAALLEILRISRLSIWIKVFIFLNKNFCSNTYFSSQNLSQGCSFAVPVDSHLRTPVRNLFSAETAWRIHVDNGAWGLLLSACSYIILLLTRSMVTSQRCMLLWKVIIMNIFLNIMARQEERNTGKYVWKEL